MLKAIESTIIELTDNSKPLRSTKLMELSNLKSEELEFFQNSWSAIQPERRRKIVDRLIELAEDNLELNFDSIFKHCLTDQDDEIRSKAVEGLWENEEPSLIDPLIELLKRDNSRKVQAAAALALGKFVMLAEHEKVRPHYKSKMRKELLAVIGNTNKSVEVRRRTLEAIAPMSLPQVRWAIMEAYRSPDSRFRISSIYAMGRNCDPYWLPMLLKELGNVNAEMRYEAAGACGELEEEETVPRLAKLINDVDVDVQMVAIQALGKIGNTEARECLEQCLDSEDEVVRQTAEQVLNDLKAAQDPLSFQI